MSQCLINYDLTVSHNAQVCGGCQEDVLVRAWDRGGQLEEVEAQVVLEHEQIRLRGVRGEDPCVSIWIHTGLGEAN